MPKELYLKIDDDVTRTVAKVTRANGSDLTLVFPKGAMVLANVVNLKLLKKQLDLLGKNVSIMTMDPAAQARAVDAGFALMTFEMLRKGVNPVVAKPFVPLEVPKPDIQDLPIFAAVKAPVRRIFETVAQKPALVIPEKPTKQPKVRVQRESSESNFKTWIAVALLLVVFFGLGALVLVPHADIVVYAHTQPITRELQINIDKGAGIPDPNGLIMPGQILDKDQQQSKTYTTNGKQNVGVKAQGLVQIYNYTGKTLKFKAATTTFTVGKNLYHLLGDVSGIKPTRNISGTNNPDPASLSPEITVLADQAGDTYNVPAGTRFEIHNQVLGDVPSQLYASTTKALDGGSSKFTTVVSQADLDTAKEDLKNTLITSAKQQLLNKSNLVLVDSGAQYTIAEPTFDKLLNDASVTFNGSISGHIKALVFDQASVQNLVTSRIQLTLDRNQSLKADKGSWEYTFKSLDLDKGAGLLSVKYSGTVVFNSDPKEIQAIAGGKSVADLKDILLSDSRIDGADISLRPFWAKTLPSLSGRISVQVKTK